ncbi:Pogo transposable element with KRAB domain, partial [Frankliniella fusca]
SNADRTLPSTEGGTPSSAKKRKLTDCNLTPTSCVQNSSADCYLTPTSRVQNSSADEETPHAKRPKSSSVQEQSSRSSQSNLSQNTLTVTPFNSTQTPTPQEKALSFISQLRCHCDDNVKSSTRNVLAQVLSNSTADKFSLHGAGSKKAFKSSLFFSKILPKVLQNAHNKDFNFKDMNKATENWLRLACQRKGGKFFKKWTRKVR